MIKKLLSLPPNLVGAFHKVTELPDDEYFCTNDPVGQRLGSGGGTTWLLEECHKAWGGDKKFIRFFFTPEVRADVCRHTLHPEKYSHLYPYSAGREDRD